MNIAIIPARGGSKRIPRKNIRVFCGKPIIAYSIEAAINSNCFDRVIVSTDDTEIADVATSYGAEVPFIRDAELANDHVGTTAVVKHAIEWLRQQDQPPALVCCIYATAPFITAESILAGLEKINMTDCDFAFSVTSFSFPVQRAIGIDEQGRVAMFQAEHYKTRSQDLEPAYHDAGQFYWGRSSAWLEEKAVFSSASIPVLIPRYLVQDIDTMEDWLRAEAMYKSLSIKGSG